MGLRTRLDRLEAAAFDGIVVRLAAEQGLSAEETGRAVAEAHRIAHRLAGLRAAGLSGREALTVCASEAGLDVDEMIADVERIAAPLRGAERPPRRRRAPV